MNVVPHRTPDAGPRAAQRRVSLFRKRSVHFAIRVYAITYSEIVGVCWGFRRWRLVVRRVPLICGKLLKPTFVPLPAEAVWLERWPAGGSGRRCRFGPTHPSYQYGPEVSADAQNRPEPRRERTYKRKMSPSDEAWCANLSLDHLRRGAIPATVHATGPSPPRRPGSSTRARRGRRVLDGRMVSFYECGMRQPRLDIAADRPRARHRDRVAVPEHCAAA